MSRILKEGVKTITQEEREMRAKGKFPLGNNVARVIITKDASPGILAEFNRKGLKSAEVRYQQV